MSIIGFVLLTQCASDNSSDIRNAIQKIDATSFPNSLSQNREDGLRSFGDYGFTVQDADANSVTLYSVSRDWSFSFSLIDQTNEYFDFCIMDLAENGGTYASQDAYRFKEDSKGMLVFSADLKNHPACLSKRNRSEFAG